MTSSTVPIATTRPRTALAPVWRTGAIATVAAAVAAVVLAVVASAIDVPLTIDGEEIPVLGFGTMALLWSAVGTGMAAVLARRAKRPARTFVVTTIALTIVSFVPVVNADASTATQVTLALAHVLAAAIVIPALALRLAHDQ
jgi:peptidoglycan/LPS O-acetylase OafA/YrhL